MFRKKQRQPDGSDESRTPGIGLPGILSALNVLPKIMEIFKDNRGKMSSKRFGAGALVASGIALVTDGAEKGAPVYYWCGLALCGMGVVLFAFTRWDGAIPPGDQGDPPNAS